MRNSNVVRALLTGTIVLVLVTLWGLYDQYYGVVLAQSAPMQLEDSNLSYLAYRWTTSARVALDFVNLIGAILISWIWWKPIWTWITQSKAMLSVVVLLFLLPMLAGCRPYGAKIIEEIEPNETAFVVPLTGATSEQGKFASAEYLESMQVATKRIEIEPEWHQLGHLWFDGKWLATARVIKVDRSPVTREWTSEEKTGTSTHDDAFRVESIESIDFAVGGNLSALIREEDAAQYLYIYAGKPLTVTIDTNVRGYMQGKLALEFGRLAITEAQAQKGDIFARVCEETTQSFLEFGITITSCGPSGGLIYADPKIQEAITQNFVAQQAKIRAQAALEAQVTENEKLISKATAEAEALRIQGQASSDVLAMRGEQLGKFPALVDFEIATRSTGQVPSTLFYGGGDSSQLPFPFFMMPADSK